MASEKDFISGDVAELPDSMRLPLGLLTEVTPEEQFELRQHMCNVEFWDSTKIGDSDVATASPQS